MRIVIIKLAHEKSTMGGEMLDIDDMSYAVSGEEFRADIRFLDVKPFGHHGWGSLSLTKEQFDALDPAVPYELAIGQVPPALHFQHCYMCGAVLDKPQDGICKSCIPF
jgi:hypothetical protein